MEAKNHAALGLPGEVTIGTRQLPIPQQTPADIARVHEKMRALAQARCVSPLAYVNAAFKDLEPALAAEAVRAAVAMGSGGGVEPTREAVARQYGTPEGVRFRLWYQARKADPSLTQEQVAELVTEENVYEVADALDVALGLAEGGLLGKEPPPRSGNSS